VSEPASISRGIAERYATAVFELAQSDNKLDRLEADIDALDTALRDSPALADMVRSPLVARGDQQSAVSALASAMGLSGLVANTLALMASKRRLFVLPALIAQLREQIADARGIVTAEVASAAALSDAQLAKLSDTLRAKVGKDVKITATVDETLIGGLVVKVGSRMIDTSIAAKLATLQKVMKEVG